MALICFAMLLLLLLFASAFALFFIAIGVTDFSIAAGYNRRQQ